MHRRCWAAGLAWNRWGNLRILSQEPSITAVRGQFAAGTEGFIALLELTDGALPAV